MVEVDFPAHVMFRFVETPSVELGHDILSAVLLKAGLPEEWAHHTYFAGLDNIRAAQAYSKLWQRLLDDAAFWLKTQSVFICGIPRSIRQKPALELLVRMLSATPGNVAGHIQDRYLLLVDRTFPATQNQLNSNSICFVTLGMIRKCLFWAGG